LKFKNLAKLGNKGFFLHKKLCWSRSRWPHTNSYKPPTNSYKCIQMYTYVYTTFLQIHTCQFVYICRSICIHLYTKLYTYVYKCIQTHTMYTDVYKCIHLYTNHPLVIVFLTLSFLALWYILGTVWLWAISFHDQFIDLLIQDFVAFAACRHLLIVHLSWRVFFQKRQKILNYRLSGG